MFHFDVSFNNLNGTLPADIGENFKALKQLYLDHNQFTGTIPESYSSVGSGRLYVLTLNDNLLTGSVPTTWGKDNFFVDTIYVQHNNLTIEVDKDVCKLDVFEGGELVEFRADCNVCSCKDRLCEQCY